jgi:Invasion associated locus B (IalB) protein
MRSRRPLMLAIAGVFCFAVPHAHAEDVAKLATLIDWALYTDGKSPHKFCFVTSEPKSSEPADTAREAPRIYVSAWPPEGIKSEISVRLGFPPKKASEISASVAPASFKLFAADERAYVQDQTQELKLFEAMKKGSKLTISATTATGAAITDTYSLAGLGQALQELQKTCF